MDRNQIEARMKSLLETKGNAGGFIYAEVSNGLIYATADVDFEVLSDVCHILSVADSENTAWMSFPLSVVGNGPHKIELPLPYHLDFWWIKSGNVSYRSIHGFATYTLSDDRNTIHGVIDLVLGDGITMVGGFYVTRA
ncbi:hypothetical protein PS619_02976 [Pseudomonas fluorescens]|uniref:Uncharacterized protein n=1 Tax=Pseudomonas tensinigenes TaxID=2745511 RepID=A0ABX8PRE4_9PSED|nr:MULTISPECIES: hypothetical protein [Pseudomonas]QXI03925.1 hypothetical protein HU718_018005 [Pseudomonas tensinigenes]VVM94061.1 hypothetical protein PS619_02976 [Pseudomonas fluorescens]VVN19216.1 hypothetical protein PS681_04244 [Pseudomonas fluorescens]VVN50731.1 hypothetical protein PS684_00428 [Pseudomonas fluorescens]